ncbi:MAG: glycosyltransferase [Alphaproteobacteria bacterium]|nr:glycosyltransferase [Alphaproteobacteria bacterium]
MRLLDAIPASTVVARDFSAGAKAAEARLLAHGADWFASRRDADSAPAPTGRPGRLASLEWLPLGGAALQIPHALGAARRLLDAHDCKAILVNADPVAGLLVAERLARERGLPLISDLRDPWGACELRRPLRPVHTRWIEGWAERRVMARSDRVILNTETTRQDYLKLYSDLDLEKFSTIRNHAEPALLGSGDASAPDFPVFTILFLGSFSRFVRPDPLLCLLAALKDRGVGSERLQLALTAPLDVEGLALARRLRVAEQVRYQPPVRLGDVGELLQAADLLVLIAPTRQRIQAKFYDYVCSERPVLALAGDHPELHEMLDETGAGAIFAADRPADAAAWVTGFLEAGRHPVCTRSAAALDSLGSARASARLAQLLDQVTSGSAEAVSCGGGAK